MADPLFVFSLPTLLCPPSLLVNLRHLDDTNFRLPDPGQESLTQIKDAKWLKEASKQASIKILTN